MTDLRKAAEMALEVMEYNRAKGTPNMGAAIEALRQALAMENFSEVNQELEQALAQPDLAKVGEVGVWGNSQALAQTQKIDIKKLKVTLVDRHVDVELEQYKRMFEAACSALGAIGDALGVDPEEGGAEPILAAIEELKAAQPEQEPVANEVQLNIIRWWPDGFAERLEHVWKDLVGFIPNYKLYDLQRMLAEYGFTMKLYEGDAVNMSQELSTPLYTAPPKREWVGLTDEEIYDMYNEPRSDAEMVAFAREVEAKLKEKNT